ncbi:MAG: hypothetical protein CME70_19215 [Halobacteriovorax sp.]|nr:hypothetical protein [Halobacteriovorax sp.]
MIRAKRLLKEYDAGYTVPEFQTTADMEMFLDELEPGDQVETDVEDPESFEMMIPAGESMEEQEWYPDSQWYIEPEEKGPITDESDPDYDWDAHFAREDEAEAEEKRQEEEAEEKYEALKEKILNDAEAGGEDWAMDTMHDAYNNPKMWQDGSSYQQWDSPGDYVLQYGQDASADIASGYTEWADSKEVADLYSSLPDENKSSYSFGYGNSRPSKQIFKDIVADTVYTGISNGVSKYIKKYGEWISGEDPAKETIAASYNRILKIAGIINETLTAKNSDDEIAAVVVPLAKAKKYKEAAEILLPIFGWSDLPVFLDDSELADLLYSNGVTRRDTDAIENEAWKIEKARQSSAITSDPDKEWLELLANHFTSTVTPEDLKTLGWKEYKRYIRLSAPDSISHGVGEVAVPKDQIDVPKFLDFLNRRAGKTLGRRPPQGPPMMPYYD